MGFIPIFITLGGFVLLFMMVVHQTFKNKKKEYYHYLDQLVKELVKIDPSLQAGTEAMKEINLKDVEQQYFQLKKSSETSGSARSITYAEKFLAETKRSRYQYNRLFTTKPYSLVARILNHSAI